MTKSKKQTQIELEELFDKNQTMKRLRREFDDPLILRICLEKTIPLGFAIDLLCQMVLHKRAPITTLLGILGPRHFSQDDVPSIEEMQACSDMIVRAAEADLVHWSPMDKKLIMAIDVSEDVYAELELYQYPLPLIVPPAPIEKNTSTGYHSAVAAKGSVILNNNHHENDVCLDHLNRLNRTRLQINSETAMMVKNSWRHLDKRKPGEDQEKYAARVKAFEKYDRTAKDVLDHVRIHGNEFYLTHRYDTRGRTYSQGYHVNPQGNDWNKAIVEFAKEEVTNA